jgi:hypothetical protein
MVDKLEVDLIAGNADKAIADVNRFRGALTAADVEANRLGTATAAKFEQCFSKGFAAVQRQALALDFTLRKIGT